VVPKHEQDHPGLVQLLSKDDGGEEHRRARAVHDAERERNAGEGDDERANAPDEADTAVVTIGRAESRDVTDRPPAEDSGEDDQAIDEEGGPSVDLREIRQPALAPSR
jgi:hypothetical protein